MQRLQPWLVLLAVSCFIGAGCGPSEESTVAEESDYASVESPVAEEGTDVTDEYIADGEDERVSPHGKVRSSIPDEIIVCDVDYSNDSSGGSGSYSLEVDFQDGEPVRINFPNGGWRHVYPMESGDSWECSDDDVTYTIYKPSEYASE